MSAELKDIIRAAGGIVHSDGNIFFTNAEQFKCAALASQATPAPGSEWRTIETAPKDRRIPMLLWVPMWKQKLAEALPLCGYWMDSYWVIVNAEAAIQRVEPTHWMPLTPPPCNCNAPLAVGVTHTTDGKCYWTNGPAAQPAPSPAAVEARPINCGTGHCSCIECLYATSPAAPPEKAGMVPLTKCKKCNGVGMVTFGGFSDFKACDECTGIGIKDSGEVSNG